MTSDTTLPVCPLQPSNPHLWHLTLLIFPVSSPQLPPGRGRELWCRSWQSPFSSFLSLCFSLSPRGRAACSGKNLCGDRCAYQTPALSPAPRGSHNYLLARFLRLSSNAELNLFQRTSLLSVATVAVNGQDATEGRSELSLLPPSLSPGLSASHQPLYTLLKHIGTDLVGRGKALRVEI